mmetsp:Transcript_28263/g.47515  ORF Transcript_28263/g.47515 Transcript_28263/m.47515 type:complete len:216 (-) Transcript_28263:96-743(-)|eukprot:CAMPEP_0174961806 /NCGR_PEP_ID=MMETSP0004_2-20121128/4442_1 /TAXON_ID=420556 /ORGANISM="Ochromonas sp., Strain CCMP1393" /LENGTH=215 /DNA_ID=CAMNT_0016210287 /DNA_START=69 /DNA_END=716 /DNA_ORIENTATION=+
MQTMIAVLILTSMIMNGVVSFNLHKPFCSSSLVQYAKSEAMRNKNISPITRQFHLFSSNEDTGAVAEGEVAGFDLSAWLSPNTRGGVIVWTGILILIPVVFYNYFVAQGMEDTKVGAYVGAIFVLLTNLLWASTYIFRVANKDMTYAQQLRDYENAVLQKRLEELADDEINALMAEIEAEEDDSNGSMTTSVSNEDSSVATPPSPPAPATENTAE